ncbi:CDP-alcohol phosphatidyltransferase-like enzyme [Tamaricihabitans halophyticus]|uniref:CDP-alcohol phosphatidyltransferase-like enzyme n=1 Tax=Tamaricihabitans halophyticus TaxID=1262583 RepID=A0A4R2RAP5_9PSEU|nr:CDP-alcohol phosphatidyltransferase family protein [Tamaricihabitans halophyticus]TCP56495.1 CDP-alcohol phosphatidyltransferase-like enzyme [Tamaricihabitans halophyticus]
MTDAQHNARDTFGAVVKRLRAKQKSAAGVPAYTRYVNRPLGKLAAAGGYLLGFTANQLTVLSGIISFASLAFLAILGPSWLLGIGVAAGLAIGYILDSADGQLARLRGGGALAGEWLDHVVDAARMPAVHLAVLIGLFRFTDLADGYLLIPLGYLLVTVVRFFALILAEQMHRNRKATTDTDPPAASDSPLRALLGLPADFGVLCLLFVLWGHTNTFLICYTVLFVANALLMVASFIRRYRELTGV